MDFGVCQCVGTPESRRLADVPAQFLDDGLMRQCLNVAQGGLSIDLDNLRRRNLSLQSPEGADHGPHGISSKFVHRSPSRPTTPTPTYWRVRSRRVSLILQQFLRAGHRRLMTGWTVVKLLQEPFDYAHPHDKFLSAHTSRIMSAGISALSNLME